MTNGVKRPKAIIKDPKACQADGGSFVYKQSFIGKLKLETHVLAFIFLLTNVMLIFKGAKLGGVGQRMHVHLHFF